MVCRLMDFALVVLKLLMFKVFAIIGFSKIEFFNFSGTERVKIFRHASYEYFKYIDTYIYNIYVAMGFLVNSHLLAHYFVLVRLSRSILR